MTFSYGCEWGRTHGNASIVVRDYFFVVVSAVSVRLSMRFCVNRTRFFLLTCAASLTYSVKSGGTLFIHKCTLIEQRRTWQRCQCSLETRVIPVLGHVLNRTGALNTVELITYEDRFDSRAWTRQLLTRLNQPSKKNQQSFRDIGVHTVTLQSTCLSYQ